MPPGVRPPPPISPAAAIARLVVLDERVRVTGSAAGVDPEWLEASSRVAEWIETAGGCYDAGFLAANLGFRLWVPVGDELTPLFLQATEAT